MDPKKTLGNNGDSQRETRALNFGGFARARPGLQVSRFAQRLARSSQLDYRRSAQPGRVLGTGLRPLLNGSCHHTGR
jgi:hypothetical protein